MYKYITLLICLCCSWSTWAQTKAMEQEWQSIVNKYDVDYYEEPNDALKEIKALQQRTWSNDQMIRLKLWEIQAQPEEIVYSTQKLDSAARSILSTLKNPVDQAVAQVLLAEYYANEFNGNRYRIIRNTANAKADFTLAKDEWTVTEYQQVILNNITTALTNATILKNTNVNTYKDLFKNSIKEEKQINTSLYDVLLWKCFEIYQHDISIATPIEDFKTNDAKYLVDYKQFNQLDITFNDTRNFKYLQLKTLQQLSQYYTAINNEHGLFNVDRTRLELFDANANHSQLAKIYTWNKANYATNDYKAYWEYALIMNGLAIEQQKPTTEAKLQPYFDQLVAITKDYPNSFAANYAHSKLSELTTAKFNTQIEEVILPNVNNKILFTYTNVDKAYIAIYPAINRKNNEADSAYKKRIIAQKIVQQHEITLPKQYPFLEHSTEIKIDPLPLGNYIILSAAAPIATASDEQYALINFQVSDILLININNDRYQVLSRSTGKPLSGAIISGENSNNIHTRHTADMEGYVHSNDLNIYKGTVTYGKDVLRNEYIHLRKKYTDDDPTDAKIFLFTDRSIYRPGQTVYFKGIAVIENRATIDHQVIANRTYTIVLRNANRELVHKLKLTTNEFGSITGSFELPKSGLNGNFSITEESNYNGVNFNVEEYKRPKFYIAFDTLNQSYTLNKPITVKGKASAYAGSEVTDAKVTYHITRNVFYPYLWRCFWTPYPRTNTINVAEGTTTTNAKGQFDITFTPTIDPSISKDLWPTYSYTITAMVTDITGETHEQKITVNAAQVDLLLSANVKENITLKDLKSINIVATNVNAIEKNVHVTVMVQKLLAPERLLTSRKWNMPNAPLYDKNTFSALFPNHEYQKETQAQGMPVGETILTKIAQANEPIDLSAITKNGYYLITLSAIENGQNVEQRYYTHLYDKGLKGNIENPLLIAKNQTTFQPEEVIKWKPIAQESRATIWSVIKTRTDRKITNTENIRVSEEDRGGVALSYYYVWNNRMYLTTDIAAVSWTNRDLHIKWATHRDKLLPGSKETWQFTISGTQKEKVAAEMMATLYDASLDDLKQHQWQIDKMLRNVSIPYISAQNNGSSISNTVKKFPYSIKNNYAQQSYLLLLPSIHPDKHFNYNRIANLEGTTISSPYSGKIKKMRFVGSAERIGATSVRRGEEALSDDNSFKDQMITAADSDTEIKEDEDSKNTTSSTIPARSNFNETAFFAPQLHTDQNGDIVYSFELPESLTKWNLKTIAHTKDWNLGQLSGSIQTQKDVMVIPNVPRYFRQGDEVVFSTKIANLTNEQLPVTTQLDILDANTLQSLNSMFGLQNAIQETSVDAEGNVAVNWTLSVPESRYEPVIIRVTAQAGDHTDGEEHTLPVITNRTFVTTSSMLYMNGNGEKTQTFDAMQQAIKSPTVSNYKMTLEYVTNPTWYVVQALPYLTTYPYECAEQIFSKFYGNAMSMHIVNQSPAIQAMLKTWQKDSTSFDSKLAQNEGLKTALLEETPWVTEAKNEKAQQQDIIRLLDTKVRSKELSENLNRLSQLQLSDGGFGWFKGHYSNPYITRTILHGLVRMRHINVSSYNQEKATYIVNRAYSYLDKELKNEYEALIKNKIKLDNNNLSYNVIHYLYTRSYEKPALSKVLSPIHTYFINQEKQYWTKYNPYMQGMIALTLHRNGEQTKAKEIVESLRQRAIKNDELGMYWNTNKNYYYWYEAPIEQQAVLIEAFQIIDPRSEEIALMQTYLFKNKQTNRWHSTKATVDATYAILNNNEDLLNAKPEVALGVSNLWLQTKQQDNNPLGYYQNTIMGTEIKPEHANISLKVSNAPHTLPSWGAVYYQYFENTDKIAAAKSAISISKELFILKHTDKGQVLEKISDNRPLQIGDKVRVKLVVRTDRDLEYVHIKDARAACLEPKDVLSEYKRIGNVGAYQQTGDISTSFFIDHLSKGTYVLEYDTYVNAKGTYSSGIATAQCMYAPEVIGNSKGESIIIK